MDFTWRASFPFTASKPFTSDHKMTPISWSVWRPVYNWVVQLHYFAFIKNHNSIHKVTTWLLQICLILVWALKGEYGCRHGFDGSIVEANPIFVVHSISHGEMQMGKRLSVGSSASISHLGKIVPFLAAQKYSAISSHDYAARMAYESGFVMRLQLLSFAWIVL